MVAAAAAAANPAELPYLAEESAEFLQMSDMYIVLEAAPGSNGLQQRLPLHSQCLSRSCEAVAHMLASLADDASGAACCPSRPLDLSPFFAGTARPAVLLFLACSYAGPEAAPPRLDAALDGDGIEAVVGVLRLAHRLNAPRLLHAALEWAESRRGTLYAQHPAELFSVAADLHLDELRGRLAVWAVARLRDSPAGAAALLQKLDFSALGSDTAAMLLDGLAAACSGGGAAPAAAAYQQWHGPGSLCTLAAEQRQAEATAAAEDALHEQAAEDWDAAFDEFEGGEWGDELGLPGLASDDENSDEEGPNFGLPNLMLEGEDGGSSDAEPDGDGDGDGELPVDGLPFDDWGVAPPWPAAGGGAASEGAEDELPAPLGDGGHEDEEAGFEEAWAQAAGGGGGGSGGGSRGPPPQ